MKILRKVVRTGVETTVLDLLDCSKARAALLLEHVARSEIDRLGPDDGEVNLDPDRCSAFVSFDGAEKVHFWIDWEIEGSKPIACTYTPTSEIRILIEAGFSISYLQDEYWNVPEATVCDTVWLREHFLRSIEFGLASRVKPGSWQEDYGENPDSLFVGDKPLEWRFEGRDSDGAWAWNLYGEGVDQSPLWLADKAVKGRKREVRKAIKEARVRNGALRVRGEELV